jgi:CRISPR system Cascade subunit CasB
VSTEVTKREAPEGRLPTRRAPLRRLGALVDKRVRELQGRYRRNESSGVSDLAALTLYAIHQQSQTASMHRAGYGLGRSVRALVLPDKSNEKAVRRRFEALGTASTFAELMGHARGLVRQLRSAAVPLDYGRLADDLAALQDPTAAAGVRLRWGREYHRAWPADAAGASPVEPTEPPSDLEENA